MDVFDFCGRIQICYFFCYDPCFVLWGMIVLVREHGIGVWEQRECGGWTRRRGIIDDNSDKEGDKKKEMKGEGKLIMKKAKKKKKISSI